MYGQGMGGANWLCGTTGFIPGPFGMVFNMIIWVVLIWLLFRISQHFFFPKAKTSDVDESTPATILKKRYAAGELTREEFNQMTDDINQGRR